MNASCISFTKRLLVDVSSMLLIEHQANSIQIVNCAGCVSLLYNYAHKSFVAYTKLLDLHDCFPAMQEPKSTMVFSFSCSANRRLPWILALLLMMTRGDGQSTSGNTNHILLVSIIASLIPAPSAHFSLLQRRTEEIPLY